MKPAHLIISLAGFFSLSMTDAKIGEFMSFHKLKKILIVHIQNFKKRIDPILENKSILFMVYRATNLDEFHFNLSYKKTVSNTFAKFLIRFVCFHLEQILFSQLIYSKDLFQQGFDPYNW